MPGSVGMCPPPTRVEGGPLGSTKSHSLFPLLFAKWEGWGTLAYKWDQDERFLNCASISVNISATRLFKHTSKAMLKDGLACVVKNKIVATAR